MDPQRSYDPYFPDRQGSTTSSTYTTGRTASASASSTQPLMSQTQYTHPEYPEDPVPTIQHSATFYPSAQDDYFTPYGGNWDTGDFVTTPPQMPLQGQQPSYTQSYDNPTYVSGITSHPAVTLSPYVGTGRIGMSPVSGGNPSPPGGPAIYTPSTGSSPSASSPPRETHNPITSPATVTALGYSPNTSFANVDPITAPTVTTMRSSADTIPERNSSAPSRPTGRTDIISKSRSHRFSRRNMLPLHEGEVLGTKEIQEQQQQQQLDPMEYSEETGGWIRKAKSSVSNKGGSLMRSLTRKLSTYRPVSGEDGEIKNLQRARAMKADEDRAWREGYGGVEFDMFDGFDSEVPERTADAMRKQNGNTDYAYTATGEVVDLSTLEGLNADEDLADDDGKSRRNSFALTRSTTSLNPNEKSYYFPEDPDTPNWKPVTMRPLYLTILQFLALCIIGFCEFLYQYSVKRGKATGLEPHLTKFTNLASMPLIAFALWKYLPTVIAVIFGVLVQLTDAEVKRVEPYFQLSRRPKGARAADSLNIEYLTFWAVLCPVQAIRHKHWAVMLSSIAAILAFAAVPPLQSAFLNLDPDREQRGRNPNILKFIVVDKVWTRLLEAVMFIIFILIGILQWLLYRRKTGLVGDPSGIAGVAAMANKSHILMDFRGLDLAGTEKIHKQLNKRTYILHKSCLWQAEFLKENERPTETVRDQNVHPLLLRLEGGLPLMGYLVAVMIMLPLFMINKNLKNVLSKSTWFLTVLSISIKMFWEVIDRDLRILQPFYLLYKRHAHSDVLTLDYTATIPGWIIVKTIQNKHYLLTYITTITLLNEVLTVCMGSLDPVSGNPVSGEETLRSQTISLALAQIIMLGQIIGVSLVLYFRRQPFLPRQPGTISSVLAYIYASHMLPDFKNMETKSTNERRKVLAEKKKTYGFGWFKGLIDGRWHVGIDQEELLRSYKHGERFLDSVVQGVPSGLDQW